MPVQLQEYPRRIRMRMSIWIDTQPRVRIFFDISDILSFINIQVHVKKYRRVQSLSIDINKAALLLKEK